MSNQQTEEFSENQEEMRAEEPFIGNNCRFGHQCTSSCGNDRECPCQADHCCAVTKDCDGCDDHYEKLTTK